MKILSMQNLLSNWSFVRLLRLGIGVVVIIQSVQANDLVMGLLGGVLLTQSVLNIGCCGTSGCAVPIQNKSHTTDITYTEVNPEPKQIPASKQTD